MRSVRLVQGGAGGESLAKNEPDAAVRESQRPLSCYPIVTGSVILFADGAGIHAADLATGKPAITANGLLHRNESADEKGGQVPLGAAGGVARGVPRLTLDAADGVVYARVGTLATSRAQATQASASDRIIGLDLRREGLLTFQSPREDGAWAFDGAPVSDGRRVFVAMRRSDITPHAYVACFDAATGIRQWRTPIGAADTIGGGAADEITHNLLTLVGESDLFQYKSRPGGRARCRQRRHLLDQPLRSADRQNVYAGCRRAAAFRSRSLAVRVSRRTVVCGPVRLAGDLRARCRHRQNGLATRSASRCAAIAGSRREAFDRRVANGLRRWISRRAV